ncbi:MAG: hypothetical protein OXI91_05930 [Chloroflexota bacterium]|nr:hypothetical protein [Chloroflexota bacterium]
MAQEMVKSDDELPALMTPGRRKSYTMPARYDQRQAASRGVVAGYCDDKMIEQALFCSIETTVSRVKPVLGGSQQIPLFEGFWTPGLYCKKLRGRSVP